MLDLVVNLILIYLLYALNHLFYIMILRLMILMVLFLIFLLQSLRVIEVFVHLQHHCRVLLNHFYWCGVYLIRSVIFLSHLQILWCCLHDLGLIGIQWMMVLILRLEFDQGKIVNCMIEMVLNYLLHKNHHL